MITEAKSPHLKEKAEKIAKDLHISLLGEGRCVYLNTSGSSMYPFLKNGDRIKITSVDEQEIKIGDIIAVDIKDRKDAWFYVHRVVRIIENKRNRIYFTKGDRNEKAIDNPVTMELIVGKVAAVERKNLKINMENPFWKHINKCIARMSLKHPSLLHFLSRYISLIIEYRLLLFKIKRRLKKGNPVLYNTEALLLICARRDLDEDLINEARDLIREGVDWKRFSESAMRNGVHFLVRKALRMIATSKTIPQFVFDKLKLNYFYILPKAASMHNQMKELLELFAKKDIPVVPLKGTSLSKRLYGDIAARGLSADVDLLVEEKNKSSSRRLLEEAGYSLMPDKLILEWEGQNVFSKPGKTPIELHWTVNSILRGKEMMEGLWNGTRLIEDDNVSYREFEEEELLFQLSLHLVGTAHHLRQLRYVCDINDVLNTYKDRINWASMVEKAVRWKLSYSVYAALKLVKELFNADVPDEALKGLQPNFLKRILIGIFMNKRVVLHADSKTGRLINKVLKYTLFRMLEGRSIKDYTAIFFPPKEMMGNRTYAQRFFGGVSKLFRNPRKKTIEVSPR